MSKEKERITNIGNLAAILTSDYDAEQYLDTKVEIKEGTLCWIAGNTIQEFIDAINAVVTKYRI
jgi:hypothetical protein